MTQTDVEFTGLRHQCDDPNCHVAGYVATLNRMADERFPERVLDDLRSHAEAWDEGYRSGFSNAMRRMSDEPNAPTTPNPFAHATEEKA